MEELRGLAMRELMGELIGTFVENPPFALSPETVSGVSLRINEYWLRWYQQHLNAYTPGINLSPISMATFGQRDRRISLNERYDFSILPNNWHDYCQTKGYVNGAHPVAVIAILRETMDEEFFSDAPTAVGNHPIIYEHRPEAIGYALQGGDFVGGSSAGTLGGFLWHSTDFAFIAVTCAHVIGNSPRAYSPKPSTHGRKTEIGNIIQTEYPRSMPQIKCNNRIQPNSPNVDLALVQIDTGTIVNVPMPNAKKIIRVTKIMDIGQNDLVQFSGFESRIVNAKVKECNIWKEITINNNPVCFGDLFVLDDVKYNYVPATLAKPGDSGAWVVNTASGNMSWDGLLIGGDGPNVYCCYSENVMNYVDSNVIIAP